MKSRYLIIPIPHPILVRLVGYYSGDEDLGCYYGRRRTRIGRTTRWDGLAATQHNTSPYDPRLEFN